MALRLSLPVGREGDTDSRVRPQSISPLTRFALISPVATL